MFYTINVMCSKCYQNYDMHHQLNICSLGNCPCNKANTYHKLRWIRWLLMWGDMGSINTRLSDFRWTCASSWWTRCGPRGDLLEGFWAVWHCLPKVLHLFSVVKASLCLEYLIQGNMFGTWNVYWRPLKILAMAAAVGRQQFWPCAKHYACLSPKSRDCRTNPLTLAWKNI